MNMTKRLICILLTVSMLSFWLVPVSANTVENTRNSFRQDSFVLHGAEGTVKLNADAVNITGNVYAAEGFSCGALQPSIDGQVLESGDHPMGDYRGLIHAAADYDVAVEDGAFTGALELADGSIRAEGTLVLDEGTLNGAGNLSAGADMRLYLTGDADREQTAIIMSENGDITITASRFVFNGLIYAPNGKVTINAKEVDLTGAVYAAGIRINGTQVKLTYADYLPDELVCDAGADQQVYVEDSLTLNTLCNYPEAAISFAPVEENTLVTVTGGDTLKPVLKFDQPGVYEIEMTAVVGEATATDIVAVTVLPEPVVVYTATADFAAGTGETVSWAEDLLTLSPAFGTGAAQNATYNADGERGISISVEQSSDSIAAEDALALDYTLTGYGKAEYEVGNDMVLLVDHSGSMSGKLPALRQAALNILEYMGPNDRFGVADLQYIRQNLTTDKEQLAKIIKGSGNGSSDWVYGIRNVVGNMFDEASQTRDKYILVLADGENNVNALESAIKEAQESNVRLIVFQMNNDSVYGSSSYYGYAMQEAAAATGGYYLLSTDPNEIAAAMTRFADEIYNNAGNEVTFTATVTDKAWLDGESIENAPTSIKENEDGSVILTWQWDAITIDQIQSVSLPLKPQLANRSGYTILARDISLTYYDRNGKATVVYLNDVVAGADGAAESGSWHSAVYDSGRENCSWSLVSWNADYPGNALMNVYLSVSEDGQHFSEFVKVQNHQSLTGLNGRYLQVRVEMERSEDGGAPSLYDLTVYALDGQEPDFALVGSRASIRCGGSAVVGQSVSAVLDIVSDNACVESINWAVSGAGAVITGDTQLLKYITFSQPGEYTLTAHVVTADGMTAQTAVNITVADAPALDKDTTDSGIPALTMTVSDTPLYVRHGTNVEFTLSFNDPSQVEWVRVAYNTQKTVGNRRSMKVDGQYKAFFTAISNNGNSGVYELVIEAFDKYGNCIRQTRTVTVDSAQPTVTVQAMPGIGYVHNSFVITATATDNCGVVSKVTTLNGQQIQLDENDQFLFVPTEPGAYVFECTATDVAGSVVTKTLNLQVRDDTAAPNCSLSTQNTVVLGNSLTVTAFVRERESGIESYVLTLDGEPLELAPGQLQDYYTYLFTPDAQGEYSFTLSARDKNGNETTVQKTVTCIADTVLPFVSVTLSNSQVVAGDPITVTVTTSDNVAVTELILYRDDVPVELGEDLTYVYTSDAADLGEADSGTVTFKAVARDAAGNERSSTVQLLVIREDTQKPTATINCAQTISIFSNSYVTITAKDNIAVASAVLTVNGEVVTLDANGRYYFDTSDFFVYDLRLVVTDTAGNVSETVKTVSVKDTVLPSVAVSRDLNKPAMGDTVTFTVRVSDNHVLSSVVVTFDGQNIPDIDLSTDTFTVTVEGLSAGDHALVVTATDASGNVRTAQSKFTVADTEAPVVTVSSDKEKYAVDEQPVIRWSSSDNVEVIKVTAWLNDTPVSYADGALLLPVNYEPGTYTLTVQVWDAAGNTATAQCSFQVMPSSDVICPVIESCGYIPAHWEVGSPAYILVTATDDSGSVEVSLWYGDTELAYDALNDRYVFTPDREGYVEIRIRAEDEAGNYTQATFRKYVYASLAGHKLVVNAPQIVAVGEAAAITVSSADNFPFTALAVTCVTTGQVLTGEENVFTFTATQYGTYEFTATGTDAEGITDTVAFTITAASRYEAEVGSDAMKPYLETTLETSLTDEMRQVAAQFASPLDAYAYVYNNIRYGCYVNSRRGSIGAFETAEGNDYDQSSLLIAFLRQMGYPARYVSGTVTLTREQLSDLFGSADFRAACQHFSDSGRKVTMSSAQGTLRLEQVWTEIYVPYSMLGVTDEAMKDLGVWVSLDPAIKASELKTYGVDRTGNVQTKEHLDAVLSKFSTGETAALVESLKQTTQPDSVKERVIIPQTFTVLPSRLPYTVDSRNSTFAKVTTAMSDTVRFTMSDLFDDYDLGTYTTAQLFGKRVTIQYTGNTGSATIFELGASAVAYNNFTPALTIDGEIVATGPANTLGKRQTLQVAVTSGGGTERFADELRVGSMYAIVLNTGTISQQTYDRIFDQAARANGVFNKETGIGKSSYYSEDKVGSFLALAGNFYFILDDALTNLNSGRYNVEEACRTKCAVVGYDVRMEENFYGVYTKVLPGSFFIDVNLNSTYSVSREDDRDARNMHVFSSSAMGSVLEGFIWEFYLGRSGISTMHIFGYAAEQGVQLLPVYAHNYQEQMEKLSFLNGSTKADIKNAVDSGYCVLIPEQEITMNGWTGTGYLIADLKEYNRFVYRISGGLNGGGSSDDDKLDEVLNKGLTEEFFQSIGADYDDFFCELFGIGQILYGILEIRSVLELYGMPWESIVSFGGHTIGQAVASGWDAYDSITGYAEVVGFYVSMLDSILLYAEESIEGVQLLTKTVIEMFCELTGKSTNDFADQLAVILQVPDYEESNGMDDMAETIDDFLKDCIKKLLSGG